MPAEHLALAVDRQAGRDGSLLEFYRAILAFRRARPALRIGSIEFLHLHPAVLAYRREAEGERYLCLFNLSGETLTLVLEEGGAVEPSGLGGRLADGRAELRSHDGLILRL